MIMLLSNIVMVIEYFSKQFKFSNHRHEMSNLKHLESSNFEATA